MKKHTALQVQLTRQNGLTAPLQPRQSLPLSRVSQKCRAAIAAPEEKTEAPVAADLPISSRPRGKIANNVTELIGNTPMVFLNKIGKDCGAKIALKLESSEPCKSVKDRIGLNMIEDAERKGIIRPGTAYAIVPIYRTV